MSANPKDPNAPNPDRFVERDVTDLRVEVGRFRERLDGFKENMVTKAELADRRAEGLRLALTLIVPILAASLGALAILITSAIAG